jgi:hypothetical protein
MRTGFVEQNGNFEKLQELKSRSEKLKKPVAVLRRAYRLTPHTLNSPTFS